MQIMGVRPVTEKDVVSNEQFDKEQQAAAAKDAEKTAAAEAAAKK